MHVYVFYRCSYSFLSSPHLIQVVSMQVVLIIVFEILKCLSTVEYAVFTCMLFI